MTDKIKTKENEWKKALLDKKIPLLVLDHKWHQLFEDEVKPANVRKAESDLNSYIARQGKIQTDIKDLKKLKSTLLSNIVLNMDATEEDNMSKRQIRKLEEDKRLIQEINDKLEIFEEEMFDLPKKIKDANQILMIESIAVCYKRMKDNQEMICKLAKWIGQVRVELKKNIIRKQEKEEKNQEIYAYMHDLFGPEVIEIFDMKYGDENKE